MKDRLDQLLQQKAHVPSSTYRLQMHAGFPFSSAIEIASYLKNLGVGDVYSSPIFEARPGSMHGYDVTRHDRINPELGGEEGFSQLSEILKKEDLGLLLDIVPNHMGVGNNSLWWQDVLENGRSSPFAEYFDIDWEPLNPNMRNKLLLPILGAQYGEELESKKIQLAIEEHRLWVKYYDHRIPVAPRTVSLLLDEEAEAKLPAEFLEVIRALKHTPPHDTTDLNLIAQRQNQLNELRPKIHELLQSEELRATLDQILEKVNGEEGKPHSFDRLHALLEAQPYRLAFWRVSTEEINYRRFFDINDLVGLRMEYPQVFAETHCMIRDLLAKQQLSGLRIDHCDGMFDPRRYLIQLQLLYLASQCYGPKPEGEVGPNGIEAELLNHMQSYDWSSSQGPFYVVVEKILEPREYLPREWPVRGTSGYDFIYLATQIFIQGQNEKQFDAFYSRILGEKQDPDRIIYEAKLEVMRSSLASDVYALTNKLSRLAAADRKARDFTDSILERVIRETIACFPVYRTYYDERMLEMEKDSDRGRTFIRYAIAKAKKLNPDVDASAFDFLRDTLLLARQIKSDYEEDYRQKQLYFALKFQQLTGPVMAKGVEDTSFYVYQRFIASNEVGGSMKGFGISLDLLHQSNQERLEKSPDTMLGTSTHDTKRSEDVRSRLNVLSEMPKEWMATVRGWIRSNAKFKKKMEDGRMAPDENEEYLLYQTILGAWPWAISSDEDRQAFLKRIQDYATKALSEAKRNTSWLNPDATYMQAVLDFIEKILLPDKRGRDTRFVTELKKILPQLQLFGGVNALALTTLKTAAPGVPDFYQGTELWDLSLVDPDNRRPVDYELRKRLLAELQTLEAEKGAAAVAEEILQTFSDGRAKLWTTYKGLNARRDHHDLFQYGSYTPLKATNGKEEHVLAFLRQDVNTGKALLAAMPRFARTLLKGRPEFPLGKVWGDAVLNLPEGATRRYRNIFTGETLEAGQQVRLADLFSRFPVAMLLTEE